MTRPGCVTAVASTVLPECLRTLARPTVWSSARGQSWTYRGWTVWGTRRGWPSSSGTMRGTSILTGTISHTPREWKVRDCLYSTFIYSSISRPQVQESSQVCTNFYIDLNLWQHQEGGRVWLSLFSLQEVTQDRAAKFVDQMSAIGGTMGLLTGFSIISGVEILYFMGKIVWNIAVKVNKNHESWGLVFFMMKLSILLTKYWIDILKSPCLQM